MNLTEGTLPIEELEISVRYQSAWTEHAQRVAQRLQIIQMYLATAGLIFGFYYSNKGSFDEFRLLLIITFLTFAVSKLVALENRAIARLCDFMKDCERCSKPQLDALSVNLLYFLNKKLYQKSVSIEHLVDSSHYKHRLVHRTICSIILMGTNTLPICEAFHCYPATSLICLFFG